MGFEQEYECECEQEQGTFYFAKMQYPLLALFEVALLLTQPNATVGITSPQRQQGIVHFGGIRGPLLALRAGIRQACDLTSTE